MATKKRTKWRDRAAKLLAGEAKQPIQWHYVSFADERFLGVVVIQAHGIGDAVMKCHALGINPGGQVLAIPFPDGVPVPEEKWCNRLLTREEVLTVWPDAKSFKDYEADAVREAGR